MADNSTEQGVPQSSRESSPGTSSHVPDSPEESSMEQPAPIGSTQRFTQDPMEIDPGPEHSQIPTPETASVTEPSNGSSSPKEIANGVEAVELYPKMSPEDNSNSSEIPEKAKETRNLREPKKSVSIAPLKLTRGQSRGISVQSGDRSPPAYESDRGFSETTPLLGPCRSLPSVVGYDSARSVSDYPGPSTARSEDGRTEMRRKKKRMRKYHRIETHKMR